RRSRSRCDRCARSSGRTGRPDSDACGQVRPPHGVGAAHDLGSAPAAAAPRAVDPADAHRRPDDGGGGGGGRRPGAGRGGGGRGGWTGAGRDCRTPTARDPRAAPPGCAAWGGPVFPPADLGVRRGGGLVSFIWFRTTLTIPANVAGFDTAGAKAVFRVNVDDYAEVWINGAMPRTPGRPSPGAIQGFNMPNRVVLADGAVSPGDRFEIAVFAINGPISAAPGNFLFVREAKVEFFR